MLSSVHVLGQSSEKIVREVDNLVYIEVVLDDPSYKFCKKEKYTTRLPEDLNPNGRTRSSSSSLPPKGSIIDAIGQDVPIVIDRHV